MLAPGASFLLSLSFVFLRSKRGIIAPTFKMLFPMQLTYNIIAVSDAQHMVRHSLYIPVKRHPDKPRTHRWTRIESEANAITCLQPFSRCLAQRRWPLHRGFPFPASFLFPADSLMADPVWLAPVWCSNTAASGAIWRGRGLSKPSLEAQVSRSLMTFSGWTSSLQILPSLCPMACQHDCCCGQEPRAQLKRALPLEACPD